MRSVIVCESWFGNTELVARAVAEELARYGQAELLSVSDEVEALGEVGLLVVGAPTHVHGMSSAMSRKSALEQAKSTADPGPGVRGWLKALPEVEGVRAAAFDTRIDKPVALVGSAAKGIGKRLRRHGFELVAPPESFFVLDADGPLADGELERAAAWARSLAATVGEPVPHAVEGVAVG